jgi:hypothetical protein
LRWLSENRKERDLGGTAVGGESIAAGSAAGPYQAVLAVQGLWSLTRLWLAAIIRHSDRTVALPRRMSLVMPRLYLIWP